MKKVNLLIALLLIVCQNTAQSQNSETDPDYAKGLQIYYSGEYTIAVQSFTKAIASNPKNYEAYLYRGNCYAFLHQFKLSERDFNKAREHMKNNAKLDFGYGYLYNEMGNYKKAIEYLDKSIELDSKDALTYNTLGVSYQRIGNPRKAIENYTMAIKYDSTLGVAYSNRGTAIYENQDIAPATSYDIKTAIRDFDKALKFRPGLCLAWRNRGLAYSFIKKYDQALSDLNQAIKCSNNDPIYYINRGTLFTTMGRYPEAIEDLKYAISINKNLPQAYILLGEAFFKNNHTQDAVSYEMEAAIIDKSYSGIADYNIARYYCVSKDKELMMKYLKLAKRNDYFKPIDNLANFLKDAEFLRFKQDKDFDEFRQSVRGNRL